MNNLYYLNGRILPVGQPAVSVHDRGLLYGDGVFETVRVYNRKPFALWKHLQRALHGAQILGINLPGGKDILLNAAGELIEALSLNEGSIRISLTRGASAGGLWPEGEHAPTLMITAQARNAYAADLYRRGFRAAPVSFPRNERSPLVRLKTLNFLENILARREAVSRGLDEGLFLNREGALAEGTVTNLFVVRGGRVYTPPVEAGLLPGITRELTIELALNLPEGFKEEHMPPEVLKKADEAFLTSSLMEIMPLVEFDGKPVGTGNPGQLTRKLQRLYKEYVTGHPDG